MEIRYEQIGDEKCIHDLTEAAFEPMSFSDGTEAEIIDGLRKDGNLTISLVALNDGAIVGHVAFSPVTMDGDNDGWYGLGPVAVSPSQQRQGVGSKLIREGLHRLKELGASGCVLIGNPAYYSRFGFRSDGLLTYGDVPKEVVQWLGFGDGVASGVLKYSPAFEH